MADQAAPAPIAQPAAPAPAAPAQDSGASPAPGGGQIMAPQAAAIAAHAAASADAGLNAELDSAIQEHQESVRGASERGKQDDAQHAGNAPPAQDGAVAAPPAAEAPTAAAPAEKPPEDPAAARIAQYLRDQRLARAAKKQAEEASAAARAATEAANARAAAAEAKERDAQALAELAKTDPVSAIRKLVGDRRLADETIIMDVIGALKDGVPAETPMTKEQEIALAAEKAAAAVQAKLKAEQDAENARAAESEKVRVAQAKEAYFSGLATEFETRRDSYPYVDAKGFDTVEADKWMQAQFAATRRIPTGTEVLDHFEAEAKAEAERLLAVHQKRMGVSVPAPAARLAAPAVPARPSVPTSGVDSRGRVVAAGSKDDYHTRREKLLDSL